MLVQEASQEVTARWLQPDDEAEWDAFVAQHPLGLVYHLSSWKKVLEDAFPHIRGSFLVVRDSSGRIQGGLPVYVVKSWLLGNRVVSVPYATLCDPLVSSAEEFNLFLPHIQQLQRSTKSRRIEMRARRAAQYVATPSLSGSVGFKHLYLPLNADRDALFRTFSRTCVRKNITRAQNAGIVVEERNDEESLKVCHSILVETRLRLSLPPMPYEFFRAMMRFLWPKHMSFFLALQKGRPVGCFVLLGLGDFWIAEYAGNIDDSNAGVDQLLYWETIKWALDHAGKTYSFGRTAVANEGLLTYKRRWATLEEDLVDFNFSLQGETVQDASKVEHGNSSAAYRCARFVVGRVPRPVFQKIGDFCYRHLG